MNQALIRIIIFDFQGYSGHRRPMRIGTVSYLNAVPLVTGLPSKLIRATPRELKDHLLSGQVDLALLSTSVLFEHPNLYLLPDICIGCRGPVKSVRLFFKKQGLTICNINTICASPTSNAANQLTRILFAPQGCTVTTNDTADAQVVIGDDALVHPDPFGSVDLGELWRERTGLPFVFAAWISRSPTVSHALWQSLINTRQSNLQNLQECLNQTDSSYPLTRDEQVDYLQNYIHYNLGDLEIQGLARFREESAMLNQSLKPHSIQFAKIV